MFRPRNDSRWVRGHGWETKMTTGRLVIVSAVLAVLAVGVAAAPAADGVAVVIGNRSYENDRVPEVAYAHRDADAFRQYVVGMLGFDPDNIIDLRDATQAEMETTFGNERDHKGRLWSYLDPSGGSDVVVYYSGHGVPGLRDKKGYLLPSDANPDTAQLNGYPIDLLYENLGRMTEAASIRVFLDACFSGDSQAGMLIRSASPMFVSASLPDLSGKAMAVLTAASGDEVASWDERAEHGMFTHHLLDALYGAGDADRDGRVTVAETKRYLDRHLTRAARRAFLRDQTAGVGGDRTMVLASAPDGSFPKRPEVGRPAPPEQPFTVETDPAGARVRILNIAERYGPGMELPAGEYRVEASIEGYETIVEMVDHGSEGATEHRIALLRSAQPFTVVTDPAGARVRFLNIEERYRPGMELPAGEYRVEASFEGYEAIVEMVDHGSEGATEHRIALLRSAQPFTVVTEPAGARVRFLSIEDRYRPGMELAAGEYRVEASLEGYDTIVEVVRHGLERATEHRIELRRVARQWTRGERFRDCPDCPQMVVIPAGSFRMGCLNDDGRCFDSQKPVREVRIVAPFALSAHEVTFAEWDACAAAGGCGHRPGEEGWGRGDRPVINISWDDARSYVTWLSRRARETYRLPSESEWEYAARAGSETKYHFGNAESELCRYGNHADTSTDFGWRNTSCSDGVGKMTAPVGSFRANAFGLHDMHGNVWEWVEDCWNESYAGAPSDGGARLSGDCAKRVLRGGSWLYDPGALRAAYRLRSTTGVRSVNLGFRVARTLTP